MYTIPLSKAQFGQQEQILIHSEHFKISGFKYNSGIEALKIENTKGYLTILPYMGQMIWDAKFLGENLCMENMLSEPKQSNEIVATYGCFAFHSGLIRNGCPSPEDDHPLHGEMPCAKMDKAWLEVDEHRITIKGEYEYVMGFGDHYLATPSVSIEKDASLFEIKMRVQNLASVPMPLQYMCHMNTAYFPDAKMVQNIPDEAVKLRESIPGHVKPTPQWLDFNDTLKTQSTPIKQLSTPEMYDPEIVYFMDNLSQFTDEAKFEMEIAGGKVLITRFDTAELNYATRWILYNGDQKVGAYVLPATCRPEGHLSAKESGTLIHLQPQEVREFTVTTGITQAN
ncbi:aldose 1-epimerase family protein [Photobacterium rosenbergii]|uniref:aldose 1-epimerase family protein n=1 Tax=Photobacterium rosenbergii TaxID=294936 RepID=UPI001C997B44|nr:aldose 1-epimerase family protein [Photobacterium rosenbergii]MBY5948405.1 aldose 1-epimerase family protein [Photobacterium rosenbergii]